MKLVALVRAPAQPDVAVRALAEATGLTLAEARMRLAPEPPALLARLQPAEADALVAALRGAGLAALAAPLPCPGDADRTVARTVAFDGAGLTISPRAGEALGVAWPDVLAVLRGVRAARAEVERTEKSTRVSAATFVATGGLKLTRTDARTVRSAEETAEQVILLYTRDGRAATLAESRLDFACLGAAKQPASTANMAALARLLRERAPGAFHDERLLRIGRRPLPFLVGGESRIKAGAVTTTRTDTTSAVDALAEVLRLGLVQGLLP